MRFGDRELDLSAPRVMGVLNTTPDSFSDGGRFLSPAAAVAQARAMFEEGADIIDVGGESTRPGASPVSVQEELERVVPIIELLAAELPAIISIDTSKPEVMRAAVAAGATLINDVFALQAEGAPETAAALRVPVCLMHMRGEPRTMQQAPIYTDVVGEVAAFLRERMAAVIDAGVSRECLLVDPGFGFGKMLGHNLTLLRNLASFRELGAPLLVGMSRKSMIGALLDAPVEQRLNGSVAAAVLAASAGASIIRVHDVRPTVEALKVVAAVNSVQ